MSSFVGRSVGIFLGLGAANRQVLFKYHTKGWKEGFRAISLVGTSRGGDRFDENHQSVATLPSGWSFEQLSCAKQKFVRSHSIERLSLDTPFSSLRACPNPGQAN